MVPEGRFELPRAQGPLRPERSASTSSTTPALARRSVYNNQAKIVKAIAQAAGYLIENRDGRIPATSHVMPRRLRTSTLIPRMISSSLILKLF